MHAPTLDIRRIAAAVALSATMALVAAACGSSDQESRLADVETAPERVAADDVREGQLGSPPEELGLPSIEAVQADPGGVVRDLFATARQRPWRVRWAASTPDGVDAGWIDMMHTPAGDVPEALFLDGEVGAPEAGVVEITMLDDGSGPRYCAKVDTNPFVCDTGAGTLVFDFLSLEGFSTLAEALSSAMARGGDPSVQYFWFAGVPTICFGVTPTIMTGDTLGLDFSSGGSFCVSRDGALMVLQAGEVNVRAVEYDTSVDPATFRLPV